ncbi:MAG: DUF927 domain-containing protein [Pseudobdellovibrionaceae bacterium]
MSKNTEDKKEKRFYTQSDFLYERLNGQKSRKLGALLQVYARASIEGDEEPITVIKLKNLNGKVVTKHVPSIDLLTKQSVMTALVRKGYQLPGDKDKRNAIYEYISTARPKRRVIIVRRPGWIKGRYALPDTTIGQKPDDNPKIYFKPAADAFQAKFGVGGTLEEYKNTFGRYALCSTTMLFSMSFALAAALIGLCGLEGGGVHLFAHTTVGKTLAELAARSVSGEATRDDLEKWRTTPNALEAVAYAYNHSLLCLDDTSQLPADTLKRAAIMREVAYELANGQGKLRLGTAKMNWNIFFISNGEEAIAAIVKDSGAERLGGEEVRLADLPCNIHAENGIFESLMPRWKNFDDAVAAIENASRKYYGTPLRAFLEVIAKYPNRTKKDVRALMAEFMDLALIGKDKWEQRFAKKFAAAYAAGVLAARFEIFPWKEKHVEHAVLACYTRARAAIPDMDTLIERAMKTFTQSLADEEKVLDLRKMKQKHREKLRPVAGLGFIRSRPELGSHLVIRPDDFQKWFDRAQDAQLALQQLDKLGKLKRDPTNSSLPTRQVLMPWGGPKLRYYVISI